MSAAFQKAKINLSVWVILRFLQRTNYHFNSSFIHLFFSIHFIEKMICFLDRSKIRRARLRIISILLCLYSITCLHFLLATISSVFTWWRYDREQAKFPDKRPQGAFPFGEQIFFWLCKVPVDQLEGLEEKWNFGKVDRRWNVNHKSQNHQQCSF